MPLEENKVSVRREVEEGWHRRNLAVVDEVYAADFINHNPAPGTTPDQEGMKQFMGMVWDALPDVNISIEDLIAEDDKVVERITLTGTHKGEIMGIPPTGKQVTIPAITINRFTEGKIVERWSISDQLDTMQQMGVISPDLL